METDISKQNQKNNFTIDFIGIGAGRSATTWIAQCLAEHPHIFIPEIKETRFFSGEMNYKHNRFCQSEYDKKGIKAYGKYFTKAKKNQLKGEWETRYLINPVVAQKIKKEFPNVKILACLRNPIDRVYRAFYFLKYTKNIDRCCETFEQAFEKHPYIYTNSFFYYPNLKKYFDIFSRKNILVLIYEDIKKDPLKFIQGIYRFLGVDNDFVPQSINKKINPVQKTVFKGFLATGSQIYILLKKIKLGFFVEFLKKLGLNRNMLKKELQIPEIRRKTRNHLINIFSQDIKDLQKLIKKDLNFWK